MDRLSGRELGPYLLRDVLGTGGMGAVFRAVHRRTGQVRAVKVLSPQISLNEALRKRFLREALVAGQLEHPHIVTIYDAGEADGLHYIAMRLVEGVSLADLIADQGPLAPERVLFILRQVAEALDFAHAHGVVHRDLKPGNVMIGPGDQATLLDFGSARAVELSAMTPLGLTVGTPDYMAPEMFAGNNASPSVDLYGIGLLAYEMLLGYLPPVEATGPTTLFSMTYAPPPPIRTLRDDLPETVEAVLARQLAEAPEDRFATAAEFVQALTAASQPAPGLPAPPPKVQAVAPTAAPAAAGAAAPVTRRRRALPRRAAIAGGVALALIAALGGLALARGPALLACGPAWVLPASGRWVAAPPMNTARALLTLTPLPDGRALAVGGADAEIYDPRDERWLAAGRLQMGRRGHTATALADGRVLVAGGVDAVGNPLASVEIFDPTTGAWSRAADLHVPRAGHTATLLPDDRVLVAGGRNRDSGALAAAEIFDPAAGAWSDAPDMSSGRAGHTATLLLNGTVLVAGGGNASAELFNAERNVWLPVGDLHTPRTGHTATLLANGEVLVAGGDTRSAERYDPAAGAWHPAGEMRSARSGHTANLLPDNEVLVVGGAAAPAELYDAGKGDWSSAGCLETPRHFAAALLLPDGSILVAGGAGPTGAPLASTERFRR